MLVRLLIPSASKMDLKEFITAFSGVAPLSPALNAVSAYYSKHLPIWRILNLYGENVGPSDTEQQVSCLMPSHGTSDRNKSARYYSFSRENDENEESVYCFKCDKRRTSLWLMYDILRSEDMELVQVFEYVEKHFGVPFPRELLLDMDTDELLSLDPSGEPRMERIEALLATANKLYLNKPDGSDPNALSLYCQGVFDLANSRI